ncbi:MAG: glycosyltransferase family 39 protein [Clostridium sp.]|nr:glycosyltransferase family 39 protein [Clostridium sp.]
MFLFWYSFRFTQYMPPNSPEFPVERADSVLWNLLTLLVFGGIFTGLTALGKKLSDKTKNIILRCLVVFMVFCVMFFGFQWILSADRAPAADQFYVCHEVNNFMQGTYLALEKGYYCELYPQQLGLIALLELIFSIAGPNNYFAFEIISALSAAGIAFLGYRILREITKDFAVGICYCLLMTGCLPMIFYTSYVYGEITGAFFSFLAVFFALRYKNQKKHRLFYLSGILLSFSMAFLIRKNSLILMLAFCLTALLWSFKEKDRKMLVTALLAIILPSLAFFGIQQMYEMRSGIEKSSGIPASAWISMGLEEHDGRFGWYYGSRGKDAYTESGYNREIADAVCKQEIKDRLQYFINRPSYAIHFFKQKQLSQWNEPLYQAYHFSQNYSEDSVPLEDSFLFWLEEHFTLLLDICDKLQLILYLGMLLYFIFAVKKDSDMLQHILPVMIIGGFLFSMVWEAKARYIFAYYLAMFPMAVIGYRQFFLTCIQKLKKQT